MVDTNIIHAITDTLGNFINLYKVELLLLGMMIAVIVFVYKEKVKIDEVMSQ